MYSELLDHFVGKVCTIFTVEMNRDFKTEDPKSYPQPLYTYFLGRVEAIDDIGILISQPNGNLKSFFFWPNIVSISEEEELDPTNEEDAKTIESLRENAQSLSDKVQAVQTGQNLDPEKLKEMSQMLQDKFDK